MSIFNQSHYTLKRQAVALTGKFRVYDASGKLVLFSQQKAFKLKEDIRVYADESRSQEMLVIKARSIIDFGAAYNVMDAATGQTIGVLRRKGLKSMFRDEWEILDAHDQPMGVLKEDSNMLAFVRRFVSGLVPQNYDALIGGARVADYKQRFNPFRYELDVDFRMDTAGKLDRRVGLAAAILLAAIEGRQS